MMIIITKTMMDDDEYDNISIIVIPITIILKIIAIIITMHWLSVIN